MTDQVESKIASLEALLKRVTEAAYAVLCESNGVSDNEWKVTDGVAVPEWPVYGFYDALKELNTAYAEAKAYFEPEEAERQRKWKDACATARYVVEVFQRDKAAAERSPNLIESSLQRNIADAIYGNLVQTVEDRKNGKQPATMDGRLRELVERGDLVELNAPGLS